MGKKAVNQAPSRGKKFPGEEPKVMDGFPVSIGRFISRIFPGIAIMKSGEWKKDLHDIFYAKNSSC